MITSANRNTSKRNKLFIPSNSFYFLSAIFFLWIRGKESSTRMCSKLALTLWRYKKMNATVCCSYVCRVRIFSQSNKSTVWTCIAACWNSPIICCKLLINNNILTQYSKLLHAFMFYVFSEKNINFQKQKVERTKLNISKYNIEYFFQFDNVNYFFISNAKFYRSQ